MRIWKRITNRKRRVLLLAAVAVIVFSAGGVWAYIAAQTPEIANTFQPVTVTCQVVEKFDGALKENASVRNTGDIPGYIRAMTVATWVDEDGKVLSTAPVEGVDYSVQWGNNGWLKGSDGFWYYTKPVAPGENTPALITTMTANQAPEGYQLRMQILAVAIQADPPRAVMEAWGVNVTDGILTPQ